MNQIATPSSALAAVGVLATVLLPTVPTGLTAQRTTRTLGLAPPVVGVSATPLAATVAWRPVTGAISYTVEWATTPAGPWTAIPLDPRAGTQVTIPSSGGQAFNGQGGILYYYRVSAMPQLGEPGVTVVPRITPQLDPPTGVGYRQEGADAVVGWVPVPYATGYQVTVSLGRQLPPIQSVEVGPNQTEARLVNLAQPGKQPILWFSVAARYGPGISPATQEPATLTDPSMCWPASTVPGPVPTVSATATGPSTVRVTTAATQYRLGAIRLERAAAGSQAWLPAGCAPMEVNDESLTPGTQYQYRVTELLPAGSAGQAVVTLAMPPASDSPPVTATISGCTAAGCQVLLGWTQIARAMDYRVESSYGLYRGLVGLAGGAPTGTPISVQIGTVPSGVHTFVVTPLFRNFRPSPKPPATVTVTVP